MEPEREAHDLPPTIERAAPGVAALFQGLRRDGGYAILDMGPAVDPHLRLYGRYARQVRFAGLVPNPPRGEDWTEAVRALPPNPDQPYDLVLMWDLLDRLIPEERPRLMARVTELTAPHARMHLMVDSSGAPITRPLRFTLLDVDRVAQQPVGGPVPAQRQLLPAQLERLLVPFEVVHAFTLRVGFREYMAEKVG